MHRQYLETQAPSIINQRVTLPEFLVTHRQHDVESGDLAMVSRSKSTYVRAARDESRSFFLLS